MAPDAKPNLDEAEEARAEERVDPGRLRPFLASALPGADLSGLEVLQFRKGHSNLTYLVRAGGREAVMRRAPFGANVRHAHDMRREFQLLSALAAEGYTRAPRPIAFCEDEAVIGARFYLMERVRGIVLRGDGSSSGLALTPELLRRTSTALVDNLADLHAVSIGGALAAMGRPEGYVGRQVKGWSERWVNARTDDVPDVEATAAWLAAHQPPESGGALIHNDYKYDNVVLDAADPGRVVAALDWEMATLGDPLMDLGTALGYWLDADDPPDIRARPLGPTYLAGSLTRREVVERYAARSGRAIPDPLFYYVFALFKAAVIYQQIYKRWVEGHTRDPRFGALLDGVRAVGRQAARALAAGRIHGLGRA